jgi:hypothetical protein
MSGHVHNFDQSTSRVPTLPSPSAFLPTSWTKAPLIVTHLHTPRPARHGADCCLAIPVEFLAQHQLPLYWVRRRTAKHKAAARFNAANGILYAGGDFGGRLALLVRRHYHIASRTCIN